MLFRTLEAVLVRTLALALALISGGATASAQSAASQPTPSASPATQPASAPSAETGEVVDPAAWDAIVSTYVTDDRGFRYEALQASTEHMAALDGYIEALAAADPSGHSRAARLAFWINAYNAYTVKSVLDAWPVESVMQEDGFFDAQTHRVAGQEMTLNHLENEMIRARFDEPRIHFAVNCASTGCPPLRDEAYTADNLEAALEAQTRSFLRRTVELDREAGRVVVSQIFEWFAGDFESAGGVRAFIARYLPEEDASFVRDTSHEIAHEPYDWSLNGRS